MLKGVPVVFILLLCVGSVAAMGMVSPDIDARWDLGEVQNVKFLLRGDNSNSSVQFFFNGSGVLEVGGDSLYQHTYSTNGYESRTVQLEVEAVHAGNATVYWGFRFLPREGELVRQELVDSAKVKVCAGNNCASDPVNGSGNSSGSSGSSGGGGGGSSPGTSYFNMERCNGTYVFQSGNWVCVTRGVVENVTFTVDVVNVSSAEDGVVSPVLQDASVGGAEIVQGVIPTEFEESSLPKILSPVIVQGDGGAALQLVLALGVGAMLFQVMTIFLVRDEL